MVGESSSKPKVNVPLPIEMINQLDEIVHRMKRERREGKRAKAKPGHPIGAGNIVADIFLRAIRVHPTWLDEWEQEGLLFPPPTTADMTATTKIKTDTDKHPFAMSESRATIKRQR